MKKYIAPKIKQIPLSPEQAILQVCQVGGAYFGWTSTPDTVCGIPTTSFADICPRAVRGVQQSGIDNLTTGGVDSQPS